MGDSATVPSTYPSTFPAASLLVVPRNHGGTVSGVLVARDSGYLAVAVQFHGEAVAGIEVQFYFAGDDGERGEAIGGVVLTDQAGMARAARVVPAGLYVCAVENQDDLVVSTVADFADAYPVVLPVGRSYVDLNDGAEFGSQDDDSESDEGDASEEGASDGQPKTTEAPRSDDSH